MKDFELFVVSLLKPPTSQVISFRALRARVNFLSGKVTKTICAGHSPRRWSRLGPLRSSASTGRPELAHLTAMDGGNAENAGAIFGHVLRHAGLAPALASGARLALRREDQELKATAVEAMKSDCAPLIRPTHSCRRTKFTGYEQRSRPRLLSIPIFRIASDGLKSGPLKQRRSPGRIRRICRKRSER